MSEREEVYIRICRYGRVYRRKRNAGGKRI